VLKQSDLVLMEGFFFNWATALRRVLVPGAHVLVASNSLVSPVLASALSTAGLERRTEVIRLVTTMRGGDRPKNAHNEFPDVTVMPRSQWEPWLLYREPIDTKTVAENLRKYGTGALRRTIDDLPFGDVIKSHPTGKRERELVNHPSLKPQAFLRQVVRAVLPLGDGVVLDPFAGSGSTLAAAEGDRASSGSKNHPNSSRRDTCPHKTQGVQRESRGTQHQGSLHQGCPCTGEKASQSD